MKYRKATAISIGAVLLLFGLAGPLSARGPRWRQVDAGLTTIPMQTIYAADSLHIWASTYFGDVLYTKDGGFSWSSFTLSGCCSPLSGGIANSFFFFDSLHGWIAGQAYNFPPPKEGFRLYTSNGGKTWL